MKIFVTGNKGFIGTNLIKNFKNKYEIIVTDYQNNVKKDRINILEKNQLNHVEENVDVIIHLAAKTSITNSINNPYKTYYTNLGGTLNILEFARERQIKKIINISTYVYGKPLYLPIDEKHPINPHTPYNKSKILSENLCKYYSQDYGINIVTLRPFYLYGPFANIHSFIPAIIEQVRKNANIFLSGQNTRRDFLFIDDFVILIMKILTKFPDGYNVFNVGHGKSNSLEQIIRVIEKIMNIKIDIHYDKSIRPNDISDMEADITQISKLFDWTPQIEIEEGLRLTLQNYTKYQFLNI